MQYLFSKTNLFKSFSFDKNNKILLLLLIILLFPFEVFATSGCCSHHGGVDCSRNQSNGRVICNDGWIGSSCLYESMVKCQSNNANNYDGNIIENINDKSNDLLPYIGIGTLIISGYYLYKQIKKK